MGETFSIKTGELIDFSSLANPRRVVGAGLVLPACEPDDFELANEHKADPIKSVADIDRVSRYLISLGRYRDNMLFICGINFGLRVSDLLKLTFSRIIESRGGIMCFKETFAILEQKTSATRKTKRNRYVTINDAVIDAVTLYLRHNPSSLSDYMFRSESNRSKNTGNKPMTRGAVDQLLKKIAKETGLKEHISTHSLRKTFGYHQMAMSNNSPRKLVVLQKMFGHSSVNITLDYIGITEEEITDAYLNLNLGSPECYSKFSKLEESITG